MKLKNTLFIATAICFHFLICLQPSDSYNTYRDENGRKRLNFSPRHPGVTKVFPERQSKPDVNSLNETESIFLPQHPNISKLRHPQYPRCEPDEECFELDHACIQKYDPYDERKYCVPLTKQRALASPECSNMRSCQNPAMCYRIHLEDISIPHCLDINIS